MINLTTMELHVILDSLIRSDMIYIKPMNSYYEANIWTQSIPEGTDEDTLHDYKMKELDNILNYIYAVWKPRYEENFGHYDLYAEKIRDYVIDNIQVVFRTPVWEAE